MKVLTVTVPCYNSQDYMSKCIESLLKGGEDMEILIVDDGSKDDTLSIAKEYEKQYPSIIRAIHQENKGHGGAVNTGLANAKGLYFKVVDSDDWVKEESLLKVLEVLRECIAGPQTLDLLICNYVYEKVGQKRKAVMRYKHSLPEGKIFGWNETKPMGYSHYLIMHALIYRTQLLREAGLVLPEHTFYVDNLVAHLPLSKVKTMYYLNENLYRYFIGRADQSVNESVMSGRIDQQLKVNKIMIDHQAAQKNLNKHQCEYMVHMVTIITIVSSILLLRLNTEESLQKKRELWQYLKEKDLRLYYKIRFSMIGMVSNLPGKGGRKATVKGYQLVQRIYGFN